MNGKYEMVRESKISEYIENGVEFFVVDMEKKKVYSSLDLRLRDLSEKLEKDTTFIVKEANYKEAGGGTENGRNR